MTQVQLLTLLLACSVALNIGATAGLITTASGAGWARALLAAGGATGTTLVIFFAAVAAYTT